MSKNSQPVIPNPDEGRKATENHRFEVIINEQADGKTGTFYLGMSKQEVLAKLNEMQKRFDQSEITNDPNDWNYGDTMILPLGLEYSFTFDKNNILYQILIQGNIPTSLGLRLGDSFNVMESLYGKNYITYKGGRSIHYEYRIGNHYFWVSISRLSHRLVAWQISKYKFDKIQ